MSEQRHFTKEEQEQIESAKKTVKQFEAELHDPNSTVSIFCLTTGPRKEFFTVWAEKLEYLHEMGEYKEPVNTISQHIKKILRLCGKKNTIHYVHEILINKYKDERYDNRDEDEGGKNPLLNSSKDINYYQENERSIQIREDTIEFHRAEISQFKTEHYESKLDKKELDHGYLIWQSALNFGNEVHDNRQSVPTITQHTLAFTIATATMNYACGLFLTKLKKYGASKSKKNLDNLDALTTKQAGKICRGQVKNVLALFDPRNRDEAIDCNFYGLQCPNCDSYRLEEKAHPDSAEWLLFCYNCNSWSEGKTITKCKFCYYPFYQDALKQIEEEEKCPNCSKPVFMPKSRIIKLRS